MSSPEITDTTKLSDLTVGELRSILREELEIMRFEFEHVLPDTDDEKPLHSEIAEQLKRHQQGKTKRISASSVFEEIGLTEEKIIEIIAIGHHKDIYET